eukprot:1154778-Pelagomonas_calceolata.AAC.6
MRKGKPLQHGYAIYCTSAVFCPDCNQKHEGRQKPLQQCGPLRMTVALCAVEVAVHKKTTACGNQATVAQ